MFPIFELWSVRFGFIVTLSLGELLIFKRQEMAATQASSLAHSDGTSAPNFPLQYPSLPSSDGDEQVQGLEQISEGSDARNTNEIGAVSRNDADSHSNITESIVALSDQSVRHPGHPAPQTEAIAKACSRETADRSPLQIEFIDSQRFRWPIEVSIQELTKILINRQYRQKLGHAYVLSDPKGKTPYFKIGSSTNVTSRWSQHQGKCRLSGWDMRIQPATEIKQCSRLERLTQAELKNLNCVLKCVCDVQHVEYYKGDPTAGHDALRCWSDWLVDYEPYGEDNVLGSFWQDRLDIFRSDIPRYFNCGETHYITRNSHTTACQACIRIGWNAWTRPTASDRLEYACRTHIPYRWLRTIAMWLGAGREGTVRSYVELTGQIRCLVEPNFLYLMVLRLLTSIALPSFVQGGSERLLDAFLLMIVMNLIVHPQYMEEILTRNSVRIEETKKSPSRSKPKPSTPDRFLFKTAMPPRRPKKAPSPRIGLNKAVSADDPFIESPKHTVILPRPSGKRIFSAPSEPRLRPSPIVQPRESTRKRRRSNQD